MEGTAKETYVCEIKAVYSGDDFIAMVDLGVESLWKKQRIRLYGVDTPNALRSTESTVAGQIRREVRELVHGRVANITVMSHSMNSWICTVLVETANGVLNLNEYLIAKGYKFDRKQARSE